MTGKNSIRGNDRREQILATATDMFSEVGYRGTSLRDIATRVGITHPGLLYHFHSKEELLQAVLARRDAIDMENFALNDAELTPMMAVKGIIANMIHSSQVPGMIELFSTLSAEATDPAHPAHDYFLERYRVLIDETVKVAAALQSEGRVRDPNLDTVKFGQEFVALMEGLQIQWLYNREGTRMIEILIDRLNRELTDDSKIDPDTDWSKLFPAVHAQ